MSEAVKSGVPSGLFDSLRHTVFVWFQSHIIKPIKNCRSPIDWVKLAFTVFGRMVAIIFRVIWLIAFSIGMFHIVNFIVIHYIL